MITTLTFVKFQRYVQQKTFGWDNCIAINGKYFVRDTINLSHNLVMAYRLIRLGIIQLLLDSAIKLNNTTIYNNIYTILYYLQL